MQGLILLEAWRRGGDRAGEWHLMWSDGGVRHI